MASYEELYKSVILYLEAGAHENILQSYIDRDKKVMRGKEVEDAMKASAENFSDFRNKTGMNFSDALRGITGSDTIYPNTPVKGMYDTYRDRERAKNAKAAIKKGFQGPSKEKSETSKKLDDKLHRESVDECKLKIYESCYYGEISKEERDFLLESIDSKNNYSEDLKDKYPRNGEPNDEINKN